MELIFDVFKVGGRWTGPLSIISRPYLSIRGWGGWQEFDLRRFDFWNSGATRSAKVWFLTGLWETQEFRD
jgi:hypothetical protein